ncbi:hypothetical protein BRD56_05340 [Thermoplasmatales archaeon SW_10_69_26]|nr:MAG: hypothetical protein BRD56_05340 [Thermoplasmatales archaeon SW_10_69_26]
MASCKISSANLQYLLDWVSTINGEVKLELDGGTLSYREIGAAHVCMVTGSAPVLEQEGEAEIGVDVDLVTDLLKPVPIAAPDPFRLEVYEAGPLVLEHARYEYELQVLDTSGMTDPKDPDLELPCRFTITARDWSNFLRRADKASSYIKLAGHPDGVTGTAEGDQVSLTHKLDCDEHEFDSGHEDQVASLFSLDYLDSFRKAQSFQGDVRFRLGNDYPIDWEARPGECVLTGQLAPRIED